jgi:hypothetical protein
MFIDAIVFGARWEVVMWWDEARGCQGFEGCFKAEWSFNVVEVVGVA